ncbi:hypothetical protein [Ruminobacter amylophilus]|uniref:hypothetical protein n=1 Tax=Ruminobacter amylophilus TaxID=867 RepID=UPI0038638C76
MVVIVAVAYLFFKFKGQEKDRAETKQQRDQDSQEIHDKLLTHDFKISNLQGIVDLHRDKLDSIDKQLSIVNQELVKLNLSVEHLSAALKEQNEIMRESLKERK